MKLRKRKDEGANSPVENGKKVKRRKNSKEKIATTHYEVDEPNKIAFELMSREISCLIIL